MLSKSKGWVTVNATVKCSYSDAYLGARTSHAVSTVMEPYGKRFTLVAFKCRGNIHKLLRFTSRGLKPMHVIGQSSDPSLIWGSWLVSPRTICSRYPAAGRENRSIQVMC